MATTGAITARIVMDSRPRSCAYCDVTRTRHPRAVDTYTADGTEWVCYLCAASDSPLLVAAIDRYEYGLDCLAYDKRISVGRARAIRDATVAMLTEGRDPRRSPVVGTESDTLRIERAAERIAAQHGLSVVA